MKLPSADSESGDSEDKSEDDGDKEEDEIEEEEYENAMGKAISQKSAQNRAERLSRIMGSQSAPGSRFASPRRVPRTVVRSPPPSPPPEGQEPGVLDFSGIPMEKLKRRRTKFGIEDDSDEEDDKDEDPEPTTLSKDKNKISRFYTQAARWVAQQKSSLSTKLAGGQEEGQAETSPGTASGYQTPEADRDPDYYIPRPEQYREGYLASILKFYNEEGVGGALSHLSSGHDAISRAVHRRVNSAQSLIGSITSRATTPAQTPASSPAGSPTSSGATTPKPKQEKWYYKNPQTQSTGALSDLVSSSTVFAQPTAGSSQASGAIKPKEKLKSLSSQALDVIMGKNKKKKKEEDKIELQVHLAGTIERQNYLIKICRALMTYGAPTHRLEGEYPYANFGGRSVADVWFRIYAHGI